MAIKNLTALYQYNGYPTNAFVLQTAPYYQTLDMIAVKFSTLTTNTATFKIKVLYGGTYTAYLYVFDDIAAYYDGYMTDVSRTLPTEDWLELSLSSDQLSLMKSGDFYIYLRIIGGSVSYYTSGSDAPHLVVSGGSSQIKYYDGSAWANGILKYYDGSNWVGGVAKIWNGTAWADTK